MRGSFHIGTIKGIKIKIHISFLLVVIWGAFYYSSGNGILGLIYGATLILLVFTIVLLHELGHSLAAIHFGVAVRDIVLLPIGGVARLERMPEKPIQEFIVAIAGPAVNFIFVGITLPILLFITNGNLRRIFYLALRSPQLSLVWLLQFLFFINLSLLIFNLIPAFPLDGGRILRSLLAMAFSYEKATYIAVRLGQAFAIFLGIFSALSNSWATVFIAIFIFMGGTAEGKNIAIKKALDRFNVRDVLSQINIILHPNFTIAEVASLILNNSQNNFPVMLGNHLIGAIGRQDIQQALAKGKKAVTVAEIMWRNIPQLDINTTLTDVQQSLLQTNIPFIAVYEGADLKGLIGYDDIQRAFH